MIVMIVTTPAVIVQIGTKITITATTAHIVALCLLCDDLISEIAQYLNFYDVHRCVFFAFLQ